MNISLTPELENFVQEKVKSGFYTSASEVIRESLRLLSTYDDLHKRRLEQLNNAVAIGMQQLQEGKAIGSDEVYKRLQNKITTIKKEQI